MLPGVGRWPMPCAEAKGLLPGRGPAGRWPMPCEDENGLLPGRGAPGFGALPPGLGPAGFAGLGVGAAGFSAWGAAASGLGAAGSAFGAASAAAGFAGPGFGPGTGAPGRGAPAVGALAVAFSSALGACFADGSASMAARSLRATGGSTVDEGLFTNSPSSLSFARANLLSTPSSAAISCTRGFPATILLSGSVRPGRADHQSRTGLISSRSLRFHSRSAFVLRAVLFDGLRVFGFGESDGRRYAECSCESPAPQCGIQTFL